MSITAVTAGDNYNVNAPAPETASKNASADVDAATGSARVTLSALGLQLNSVDNDSVQVALDALTPVTPKTKKKAKPLTLLDVDAFRVMRAKMHAALRGEKLPNLADVVAAAKKTAET